MRLAGARGKNHVWRPPCSKLRSFRSECTVLKKAVTVWGLFEAPHSHSVPSLVIRRPRSDSEPGELCPPPYAPGKYPVAYILCLILFFLTFCMTVFFIFCSFFHGKFWVFRHNRVATLNRTCLKTTWKLPDFNPGTLSHLLLRAWSRSNFGWGRSEVDLFC